MQGSVNNLRSEHRTKLNCFKLFQERNQEMMLVENMKNFFCSYLSFNFLDTVILTDY